MANGFDPERGLVMVPLDLNNEVIKPLERLEDKVSDLEKDLKVHVDQHAAEAACRKRRVDRFKKICFSALGALLPVLATLLVRAAS